MGLGKKTRKYLASAPNLASYPPKTASICDNVKRIHYQACVWKHAIGRDPPVLDPLEHIAGVSMKNNKWLNEPKPIT